MLSFSVNDYASVDLNDYMRAIVEKNQRNADTSSPIVNQELGDLYLRVADPKVRKPVDENVNAYSYITVAAINNESKEVKKFVPIINSDEADDENYSGYGVTESVLGYVDENLESIEDRDEYIDAMEQLKELAKDVALYDDIDLVITISKALDGNRTAIENLIDIKDRYNAGDLFTTVLSHKWNPLLVA